MPRDRNSSLDAIRTELAAAAPLAAAESLPHLRGAADRLAALIDDTMAEAVLDGQGSLRSVGASAGLSENAVGPRLARTRALAPYANQAGRVTAAGVQRAQYDHESGRTPPAVAASPAPLRFKPRRLSTDTR